jgi:hypothetical protein
MRQVLLSALQTLSHLVLTEIPGISALGLFFYRQTLKTLGGEVPVQGKPARELNQMPGPPLSSTYQNSSHLHLLPRSLPDSADRRGMSLNDKLQDVLQNLRKSQGGRTVPVFQQYS